MYDFLLAAAVFVTMHASLRHATAYGQRIWPSRSLKVIDSCSNRESIYDFLLVINSDLSSISNRFWDIAPRIHKPPLPYLTPPLEGFPLAFRSQIFPASSWDIGLHFRENRGFVTMHSRYHRQQTDRKHIMTIAERCIATVG